MAAGSLVCRFNKFGYCKFGARCRHSHVNVTCTEANCDVDSCSRRHPAKCKFYERYGRCKFTEYCSYSHENNPQCSTLQDELYCVKLKCESLENLVQEQAIKINAMNVKIEDLENKNCEIKIEFQKMLDNFGAVVQTAVANATNTAVEKMVSQQSSFENQMNVLFKSIQEPLIHIISLPSSKSIPTSNASSSSEVGPSLSYSLKPSTSRSLQKTQP